MKNSPRTPLRLSDSLSHHLNMYAMAASAAGVGILALAQPAEARIVYTPVHVKILPETGTIVHLDLNHDGVNDFSFTNTAVTEAHGGQHWLRITVANSANGNFGGGSSASAVRAGVRIGPKGRFGGPYMAEWSYFHTTNSKTNSAYSRPWANGGKGLKNRYLGLRFVIKGKIHFGWARLNVVFKKDSRGKPAPVGILTGYAYETVPNKPIITGKTHDAEPPSAASTTKPQPASLGRLARGASGLYAWRSNQQLTTAQ